MQNLLKYGATVITLPTCRSAIRAATSCNKEDQPMTSPRPLKVDNQITFRLSAEIHEFQGQLGSKRSLFPAGHQGKLGPPVVFRGTWSRGAMRENQSSVPTPSVWDNIPWRAADPVTEMLGPNFWGPRMMKSSIQQLGVGDPISFFISCLHLRSLGLWGCKLIWGSWRRVSSVAACEDDVRHWVKP